MSIQERLKNFKVRVKEKARRAFGSSPSPSTISLPNDPPPTANPTPGFLTVPTGSVTGRRPASTPPGSTPVVVGSSWACLTGFLLVLAKASSPLGQLKTVMEGLSGCFAMHEDAAMARQDYRALKLELEALFSALSAHFGGDVPPTMTASMNNLCGAIEKELDQISIKEDRGTGRRFLEANKDLDEVMACYCRIQGHLERLTLNADLSTWRIVDKLATDAALKELNPSMSACYNSAEATLIRRRECTPETRKQVLAELSGWRHDREQGNIFWLNGMAGTGKTTIATSLCAMLERTHDLGASFFCTRQLPECRNVKLILPSIAYQLACFSRPFRCALSRALESDPNVHTKALPVQLEGMILAPLREVANTLPTDLVVVIDALDEVEDSGGVGQMLETLVKHASNLPIKFFVSSRPEPQIRQNIGSMKSKLVLHELDGTIVKGDIELYLRTELERMSLSDSQLAVLVERAGVLFIYASTVVRYITAKKISSAQQERLNDVLGASPTGLSNANSQIDALYTVVLDSALTDPDLKESDRHRIRLILHTVICAREPLTVGALAGLLQLGDTDWVDDALDSLWSVLQISDLGADRLVTTLHASFPDYMLSRQRSQGHSCDIESQHGRLAELCFARVQNNKRQFNICDLESSYILDEQVPNLEERVNQAIPLDLAYACLYWPSHLAMGGRSSKRAHLLDEFISTKFLLWMEVLNLTKRLNIGPTSLEKARSWCSSHEEASDTKDLIHDAWRFVSTFAANPVSRSTPHIYVSMLASWPRSRPVAKRYIQNTDQLVELAGTALARRELHLLGAFATDCRLTSAALSPDGMHIVCGSDDKLIRIWDTRTGRMALGPLAGHNGPVSAVAFSPDGMRIVSGSRNYGWEREPEGKRIRVWDAQSGEMVLGPLEGHAASILSVAFSPDGTRIVAGSADETIRVWDAQSGHPVEGALEGHTDSVFSVAFSPNGRRIVSGSDDKTVRVWNARSGEMELGPLEGHTSAVASVAFSPDGMRIVSGSKNVDPWQEEKRRIRVWDAQSGELVLGPLEGHTASILSVAFSPDGMRIVSSSRDYTILVWDAQSGQVLVGPLLGHTRSVVSVAFSPDSMRIISTSYDGKIRVWDSQSEQLALEPLEGHTKSITSVAFSPDGTRIVSGSEDKTIRLWDVQSGTGVLGPLEGHAGPVRSVVFSPDGMRIVSGSDDQTIRVWDSHSGVMVLGPLEGHSGVVRSVAFSPDGSRIVSGSEDKTIRVWDAQSGQTMLGPLEGHTNLVLSVGFSPDGMRIVSGSMDMTIRMWDAQDGQMMLQVHVEFDRSFNPCSVPFSPDGIHIVSGSFNRTVQVWDSRSGDRVAGPLEGHTGPIWSVAFSPDGRLIVSGSSDKTIRVWDVKSGQMVLGPLEGHTNKIQSVAFSPDGMHIVSGSDDKTIRLWRMPDDLVAKTQDLNHHSPNPPLTSGDFATSGHNVVSTPFGAPHPWELEEDGWVRSKDQSLLLWVPHDLRDRLLRPVSPCLISRRGSVQLTFDHANIGESWVKCYKPS